MKSTTAFIVFILLFLHSSAQVSLPKVKHAEPLYMDLVRDIGARRGEKELNIGTQISSNDNYTIHSGFIEYEFAPVNRLGFEIELPFTFYHVHGEGQSSGVPRSRMEGVKLATQYTFLVNEKKALSAAVLYTHEVLFHSFFSMNSRQLILKAHSYNPALVVAKRWGSNTHSMIYTGPEWMKNIAGSQDHFEYHLNASMHYMIPETGNFIGVEMNQAYESNAVLTTIRPQTKITLNRKAALGIVGGIPLNANNDGVSFMLRLIYEP